MADVQYTLTIHLQNHKAADVLNNGKYQICVGYPEDDNGFEGIVEGNSPKFNCSHPATVRFSARPAAGMDYYIGYAKEFSQTSHVREMKLVKPGQLYRIDESKCARVEDASWVPGNAFGFENSIKASPVVFRKPANDHHAPLVRFKTFPVWVPGKGTMVPPNPSMAIKVWLRDNWTPEDEDDMGYQDESKPFRVDFRGGNPTATIAFREDGTFGRHSLAFRNSQHGEEEL